MWTYSSPISCLDLPLLKLLKWLHFPFLTAGCGAYDSWWRYVSPVFGAYKHPTRSCVGTTLCNCWSVVKFQVTSFTCISQPGGTTPWTSSLCTKLNILSSAYSWGVCRKSIRWVAPAFVYMRSALHPILVKNCSAEIFVARFWKLKTSSDFFVKRKDKF